MVILGGLHLVVVVVHVNQLVDQQVLLLKAVVVLVPLRLLHLPLLKNTQVVVVLVLVSVIRLIVMVVMVVQV